MEGVSAPLLVGESLSRRYGGAFALRPTSLEVRAGDPSRHGFPNDR